MSEYAEYKKDYLVEYTGKSLPITKNGDIGYIEKSESYSAYAHAVWQTGHKGYYKKKNLRIISAVTAPSEGDDVGFTTKECVLCTGRVPSGKGAKFVNRVKDEKGDRL